MKSPPRTIITFSKINIPRLIYTRIYAEISRLASFRRIGFVRRKRGLVLSTATCLIPISELGPAGNWLRSARASELASFAHSCSARVSRPRRKGRPKVSRATANAWSREKWDRHGAPLRASPVFAPVQPNGFLTWDRAWRPWPILQSVRRLRGRTARWCRHR